MNRCLSWMTATWEGNSAYISGGYMNRTITCVLTELTQSHLICLMGCLKGSDRLLAVTGMSQGDGDIPVAALCTLWVRGEDEAEARQQQ